MWSDIIQHGVKLIECSYSQVRSLAPQVVILCPKNQSFSENFGDTLIISSEYCNGGSLSDILNEKRARSQPGFSKSETRDLLRQLASGLNYIHKKELAHLDIKPGNIFRSFSECVALEVNFAEEESGSDKPVYKIGDLGHVTSIEKCLIDEGDCRYAARELLNVTSTQGHDGSKGQGRDIRKSDIFSMGLTVYEAATLVELPKNGPEWHQIRSQGVPACDWLGEELNDLIGQMIREEPSNRPTANEIHENSAVSSFMSNLKLQQLLQEEINKNKRLQR